MNETPPRPFPMMGKTTWYAGMTITPPLTKNGTCTTPLASACYAVRKLAPATAEPSTPSPPLAWKITSTTGPVPTSTTSITIIWPVASSASTPAAPISCLLMPSVVLSPASPTRLTAPRSRATRSMAPMATILIARGQWEPPEAIPASTMTH